MFPKGRRDGLREKLVAAATTLLFVFYVNYLPVHLSADHAHDPHEESAEHWHDPGHAGHDEHHVPHPASEHELQLLAKSKQNLVGLDFLPSGSEISIAPPLSRPAIRARERRIFFRIHSREPQLPRAPPQS
jgi:hypothetical protein